MLRQFKIFGAVLSVMLLGTFAFADVTQLSALIGYSSSSPNVTAPSPVTLTGKGNISYGVQAEFKIPTTSYGLGVGFLNVTEFFHETVTGAFDLDLHVPYWQLPVTFRYFLLDYLTFGLGGYYAFPAGQVQQSGTVGGFPVSTSTDFGTDNTKTDDYGLVLDAAVYIPIGVLTSITARVMYEYGLENDTTATGSTANQRNLLFYAGLAFGI